MRLFILIILLLSKALMGVEIDAGSVSGSWLKSDTPHYINGDISVENGTTLTIEPGVEVIFSGHFKFSVNGQINAVGSQADSIRFYSTNTNAGWAGLKFDTVEASNDTSKFKYCSIKYCKNMYNPNYGIKGGAFYIKKCEKLIIENCSIIRNVSQFGGAIHCYWNGNAVIRNNDLSYNEGESEGGAIYIDDSKPFIDGNIISNNSTYGYGGGVYGNLAGGVILNNQISSNIAGYGGGISFLDSYLIVTGNTINNNNSNIDARGGGGCYIGKSNMSVTNEVKLYNNKIHENTTAGYGGGIYLHEFVQPKIVGNLIVDNGSYGIYCGYASSGNITNCTILANSDGGIYYSQSTEGIAVNCILRDNSDSQVEIANSNCVLDFKLSNIQGGQAGFFGTTFNGTYENNIDTDPLFLASGDAPYQLAANSPCKNAGTEDASGLSLPGLDLMGNPRIFGRIDMGAYELPNQVPVINSYTPIE
ncbi:MAG: hypothetical protein B6I18_09060, partial [Bacteroidetes bacterium 4572_112]